jgi:hypothetical protein
MLPRGIGRREAGLQNHYVDYFGLGTPSGRPCRVDPSAVQHALRLVIDRRRTAPPSTLRMKATEHRRRGPGDCLGEHGLSR